MHKTNFLSLTFILCFTSGSAFASGWVKSYKSYYGKVSGSKTSERTQSQIDADDIIQQESTLGFYGEFGLPTPALGLWPSQLSVSTNRKEINRRDAVIDDSFAVASIADTELQLKHQVLARAFGPVSVNAALITGGKIPTTKRQYRTANRSFLVAKLPDEDRQALVSTIDKGEPGYILGSGASLSYNIVWLNLSDIWTVSESRFTGGDEPWRDRSLDAAVGFGLPFNSWIQCGYGVFDAVSGPKDSVSHSQITKSNASLGLTFWQGWAAEGSFQRQFEQNRGWQQPAETITLGLSNRTL